MPLLLWSGWRGSIPALASCAVGVQLWGGWGGAVTALAQPPVFSTPTLFLSALAFQVLISQPFLVMTEVEVGVLFPLSRPEVVSFWVHNSAV